MKFWGAIAMALFILLLICYAIIEWILHLIGITNEIIILVLAIILTCYVVRFLFLAIGNSPSTTKTKVSTPETKSFAAGYGKGYEDASTGKGKRYDDTEND